MDCLASLDRSSKEGEENQKSLSKILIVEDEPQIAEILEAYLKDAGFETDRAIDGIRALELFHWFRPDLVILDVLLPGRSGLEVLQQIRKASQIPILILTARAEEEDRLLGFELGADDYVIKPFRPREVVARVKAILRRQDQSPELLRVGPLEVDLSRFEVRVHGERLNLTASEFRLLKTLAMAPGKVFSRGELIERALPESEAMERVIDTHMANLRRKLAAARGVGLLETVRGAGYRLVEP